MAVTANQRIKSRNPEGLIPLPVKTGVHLYQGTLAFAVAATGFGIDSIASGANAFMGVVKEEADNTAGADGDVKAECWTEGGFEMQGTGFTQALVGDKIYAVDNFTVNATSTNQTLVGRCTEFISSTRIMVKIEVGTQA